jgi:type I restriction enzyme S subunit
VGEQVTLGEYTEILTGFPFKSAQFTEDPLAVRLLRGDNISQGRLRWDGSKRWPRNECAAYEQFALEVGDVVVAMDRPWIEAGLKYSVVRATDVPCLLVQRVARLRSKSGLDQGYLRWLIASEGFTDHVQAVHTGTTVPHISASQIASFRVPRLPSEPEQQAVAEVLGALDDKIESNRRLRATADELIRVELSFAQDGDWPEVPVSSLARFVNGGAYTNGATGSGRMVIRIAELRNGPGGSTVYNELDVPDERLARPGDVLMSWSGSLGVFRWARPEAIINQHIFKVICERYPAWFVYVKLGEAMPDFQRIAADKATTMGHIKRHHLDDAKLQVPSEEVLRELDEAFGPLWQRLVSAEVEALTIEALRDALLSELLSGRLRVKDAEMVAEAVT